MQFGQSDDIGKIHKNRWDFTQRGDYFLGTNIRQFWGYSQNDLKTFFTIGTVLDVKQKNSLDLIDRQNLCIGNTNDTCRRTIKHVLIEFEGTWMILTMPITFGLKTFNREGKQDI